MTRGRRLLIATAGAATLASGVGACGAGADVEGTAQPQGVDTAGAESTSAPSATAARAAAKPSRGQVRTVATGLEVPWDVAFLPDRSALVSERDRGRIVQIPAGGGAAKTFLDVPGVEPEGEGGLLGLAVSRGYEQDHTIYAYFSASSDNRIVAIDTESKKVTPLLTGLKKAAIHNGGALELGPDGKLYAGVGDAGDSSNAQNRGSRNGKILRIETTGKIPTDNPFKGSPIWSYGHRNVQGLTWDRSGRLWASEFGQNTTDEVNLIRKGGNYRWPTVEGKGTGGGRFVAPKVTWTPTSSSSPSGAAIAGRDLYVGALAGGTLWRIRLNGTTAGRPTNLFKGRYGRIRAAVRAPDGTVWFTTSNTDGRGSPKSGDDKVIQLGT